MNEIANVNQLFMFHSDMETQLIKLSAWIQTFQLILEGLEAEGTEGRNSKDSAARFANRYKIYSEMLFLALSGFQDCKDDMLCIWDKEHLLISR